jgi:PhnB protein
MAAINPYVTYLGNCEEAFNLYKSVFGGEFTYVGRYNEMPPEMGTSPDDANKIMHISLPISSETILMGCDAAGPFGAGTKVGNNISLSINANSREEADRLFNGLSAGGNVTMPMNKTFWGAYFGMFVDRFGIAWMINYDEPQPQA